MRKKEGVATRLHEPRPQCRDNSTKSTRLLSGETRLANAAPGTTLTGVPGDVLPGTLRPGSSNGESARLLSGVLGVRSPSRAPFSNRVRGADNTAYPHPDVPVRAGRDEAISLTAV